MRKLMIIAVISALLLFGCVSSKIVTEETRKEENKVYDCQCHEEPWKYEPHQNADCRQCHGNEILEKHRERFISLGYTKYANATSVDSINCYDCHEKSLLKNHMPAECEICHGNPATIHEKYEKEFIKGGG